MENDIRAILKYFYRSRDLEVGGQLIGHCAPDIPASHVTTVLKEFAAGEYSPATLCISTEKILSYKPEKKKHQITEES